jgi:tRNA(fMet)-specific endonuclease VapC
VARVILDTSVLVAVERGTSALEDLLGDEDEPAIAAVSVAELVVGVGLADAARQAPRAAFLEALLDAAVVEPYDLDVARAHGLLLVHTRRAGRARGAHDLIIAATARARRRALITADRRGFEDLPGVVLRP